MVDKKTKDVVVDKVKKIIRWQALDGEEFRDKGQAENHQMSLNFKQWYEENKLELDLEPFKDKSFAFVQDVAVGAEPLMKWLSENGHEALRILDANHIVREKESDDSK